MGRFREAGMPQRRLARDRDVAEIEVRRMLNQDHVTKAATIDHTCRPVGKRLAIREVRHSGSRGAKAY